MPNNLFSPPAKPSKPSPRANSLLWIFEPLEQDASYARRRMFGCDAAYLDDTLYLVVCDRGAPWNGLLVCTSQDRHGALIAEMPSLRPHSVLGKWLYAPQDDETFEAVAQRMTGLVLKRDARVGVAPRPRSQAQRHRGKTKWYAP